MGKKSKNYGKGFEYEARDLLREATGIQSFERVPTGGAWIGGKNAYKAQTGRDDVTEIMAGDLICPENWKWTVECKNWENVPIHQLIIGDQCKVIDDFLDQINNAANIAKKEPLLMMKLRKKKYDLPDKIKSLLSAQSIKIPTSNTYTIGILVAEKTEKCVEIQQFNHIRYIDKINNISWCFFDFNVWKCELKARQFKF